MGITPDRQLVKHVPRSASMKRDMALVLALASVLVALAACGGSLVEPLVGGKAPMGGEPSGGPPSPTLPPISPANGPTYVRVSSGIVKGARERYIFFGDASFTLQYAPPGWDWTFDARGSYERTQSAISFRWDLDAAWTATGTVRGDSLIVEYSNHMLWADFVDGVYVLESNGSP